MDACQIPPKTDDALRGLLKVKPTKDAEARSEADQG
jgi:hypothetical protein